MDTNQDTALYQTQSDSLAVLQEKLNELYQPDAVEFTFDTLGWKILAVLLLIGLGLMSYQLIKKYIQNTYRRNGIKSLDEIRKESSRGNEKDQVARIFVVLKQVAMKRHHRDQVGILHGEEWLLFLEKTGKGVKVRHYQNEIADAIYKNENPSIEVVNALVDNAIKWVKTHA